MSSNKVAISRYECAQLLGISVRLLDKCIAKGDIRTIRLGDRVLIPYSEIEKLTSQIQHRKGR